MRKCLYKYTLLFVVIYINTRVSASQQRIQAFTSEVWEPSSKQWKTSTSISRGSKARLACITSSASSSTSSTFKLRNVKDRDDLQADYSHSQVIHEFGIIDCHHMGTYVCESRSDAEYTNRSIDVAIYGCEPRLCDDIDLARTIFASVNDTRNVSTCVIAYPEIRLFEYQRGSLESADPMSQRWSPQIEMKSINTFTVEMTVHEVVEDDFGSYVFNISSSYGEKQKSLEFRVDLKQEGPPECPADIQLSKTDSDSDSIMLSWQPGSHRGEKQSFQVFYTKDDGPWTMYGKPTLENVMVLTGFREDTSYVFKVVSLNKFTEEVHHNLCHGTVKKIAAIATEVPSANELSNTDDAPRESEDGIITAGIVLGVVGGAALIVGLLVLIKFRQFFVKMILSPSAQHAPSSLRSSLESQQSSSAHSQQLLIKTSNTTPNHVDSGRYISDQGLLYVTVDHSSNQAPRDQSRPKPPVQEAVQYVTLDLQKSGKYGLNDLKKHKCAK